MHMHSVSRQSIRAIEKAPQTLKTPLQDPLRLKDAQDPRTAEDRHRHTHIHKDAKSKMLDHLMPRVYNDCDFYNDDESNKENLGYFVRRPTASLRSEYDGTPVLHRRVSRGRRTPSPVGLGSVARQILRAAGGSTITPQDAKKKVMQKTKKNAKTTTAKKAKKSSSRKAETSKKVSSQSIGIIRRPLQDITHLYVNERPTVAASRRERMAWETLSTSVSMRFF